MVKVLSPVCAGIIVASLMGCDGPVSQAVYTPPVVFSGDIGPLGSTTGIVMPGNISHPNTCQIFGDTVRMFFYSEDFNEALGVCNGDRIRIDINPAPAIDSQLVDPPPQPLRIGMRQLFIRVSRYPTTNQTFLVSAADSNYAPPMSASAEVRRLELRPGGRIQLHRLTATLHRESSASAGFEIRNGEITGAVQAP